MLLVAQSCQTLQPHRLQHARPPLSITNSWSLLKLTSIESVMPSNHLILSRPAFNLSEHQGPFQWRLIVLCIKWPKYWSFSFSTSPSNDYLGLISFGIDWLGLLAVQGTLKSLLRHHNSETSYTILLPSAFFMVQLSHLHMTTGKTITLTIWTFWRRYYGQ